MVKNTQDAIRNSPGNSKKGEILLSNSIGNKEQKKKFEAEEEEKSESSSYYQKKKRNDIKDHILYWRKY